jgi:hypothetical protein
LKTPFFVIVTNARAVMDMPQTAQKFNHVKAGKTESRIFPMGPVSLTSGDGDIA